MFSVPLKFFLGYLSFLGSTHRCQEIVEAALGADLLKALMLVRRRERQQDTGHTLL